MEIKDYIVIGSGIIAIIKFIYDYFCSVQKPNANQDIQIAVIDSRINTMAKELSFIKENHISHIEKDIKNLQVGQERILVILDERLPNKK